MASRHCHSHNHRHYQTDSPSTYCCCNIDYNSLNCPPPLSSDELLHVIASYLLQSNPNPTHFETHQSNFCHHHFYDQHSKYQHKQRLYHLQHQDTHSTIASLLHRVQALESSLRRYQKHGFDSLRDTAARIIQTHFRTFLARRSRVLSQLKDLAFIQSTFNLLKSSISRDAHVDFRAISQKAMDLLLQLDSIQGDDPMIYDGKKSVTRDLIRFLDLIDGVVAKRYEVSVKTMKSPRSGHYLNKPKILGDTKPVSLDNEQSKLLENLRERIERISRLTELSENDREAVGFESIDDFNEHTNVLGRRKKDASLIENGVPGRRRGIKPKVKKCVTFTENGNMLHRSRKQAIGIEGGGSESNDDQGELVKNLNGEAVEEVMGTSQGSEDEEEAMLEDEGSTETSEEGTTNKIDSRMKQSVKLVCSAPLPVKMEPRVTRTKAVTL